MHGYPVSDTSLAAYLYTEGFVIVDIDYTDPERAEFIFKVNGSSSLDEYERHRRLYELGKATVNPSVYSRSYKKLTRIFFSTVLETNEKKRVTKDL